MHIPNEFIIAAFLLYYGAGSFRTYTATDFTFFIGGICIANLITGTLYLLLKSRNRFPLPLGFFISSCVLLSLYFIPHGSMVSVSFLQAAIIGFAQACAVLPGISRLAVTCCSGIWLGIDPTVSMLFSLACEFALIIVAVGVALRSKSARATLQPSVTQCAGIVITSAISFIGLLLVQESFITNSVVFFGWYLLALSLLTSFLFFWSGYTK